MLFFMERKNLESLFVRKGISDLATRPQFAGQWNQAGGIARHGFAGMFLESYSKERLASR